LHPFRESVGVGLDLLIQPFLHDLRGDDRAQRLVERLKLHLERGARETGARQAVFAFVSAHLDQRNQELLRVDLGQPAHVFIDDALDYGRRLAHALANSVVVRVAEPLLLVDQVIEPLLARR
jgi:hypothetical protein